MDTKEILTNLEEWAEENSDVSAYPHEPPNYAEAFPIVAAAIQEDSEQETSPSFSEQGYQQIHLQIVVVDLHVLVDPNPAWTADQALYDIVDSLKVALRSDNTLGNRVEGASPLYRVTYEGEAQTPDGTVARMATFRLTIAQRVEA